MKIQEQNFGVEIEMTGITRRQASRIVAEYFGTQEYHIGGGYDTHAAKDRKGREWKLMRDASIACYRKVNGSMNGVDSSYSCEMVTPILQYEDMEDLQNLVRLLRANGAIANDSCGIHVHVDGANHTVNSIGKLLQFAEGRQDLFHEALGNERRTDRWCRKISGGLVSAMKKAKTKDEAERVWYSRLNDGYSEGIMHNHYNATRYHGINLHAFFTKGTVEFRLFNGTTHAGKIKAYVQFCLAMSAWAINCEPDKKLHFKDCSSYTREQKADLMERVLRNRLGMTGKEFETARKHLTDNFRD